MIDPRSLLQIPPFPGRHVHAFAPVANSPLLEEQEIAELAEALKRARVGGRFWGKNLAIPEATVLVARNSADHVRALERIVRGKQWQLLPEQANAWHALKSCDAFVTNAADPHAVIASLLGVQVIYAETGKRSDDDFILKSLKRFPKYWHDPFTGKEVEASALISLLEFWKRLVDRNQDLVAGLGFAKWKQATVAPLLWNGERAFPFLSSPPPSSPNGRLAIWRSRAPASALAAIEQEGWPVAEVEDGFLRSHGLGADCVPPLSITVDRLGAYFDPSGPTELEKLLESQSISDEIKSRAQQLRTRLVDAGVGKYGASIDSYARIAGERLHVLVPGQVEDDRSVQTGGGGMTNLELLQRVRACRPNAFLIYKPHPDVEAGHRKGFVEDQRAREHVDHIERDAGIASLIRMVDEVHVNTSQAGFEALLHGKRVTTHGVPFYAGWGLTEDLGLVPSRRRRGRSLDELVAATLLLYPRYLDPVTGLPCPAEVVVDRLTRPAQRPTLLMRARRWQGRLRRWLRV